MLRVEIKRGEREQAAHRGICALLQQAHDKTQAERAPDAEPLPPLVLPPEPAPRPRVWLLVEPPADMSLLPPKAREAVLSAALSLGDTKRSAPARTAAAVDAAHQASSELVCACVVGAVREMPDGGEREDRFVVRPVHAAAPGVLPLAAIEMADRVAVQGALNVYLATFRELI